MRGQAERERTTLILGRRGCLKAFKAKIRIDKRSPSCINLVKAGGELRQVLVVGRNLAHVSDEIVTEEQDAHIRDFFPSSPSNICS